MKNRKVKLGAATLFVFPEENGEATVSMDDSDDVTGWACNNVWGGGTAAELRRAARALSPVYVVKSDSENYLGFCARDEEVLNIGPFKFLPCWHTSRGDAILFGSKEQAKEAASLWPNAGARVVRVLW